MTVSAIYNSVSTAALDRRRPLANRTNVATVIPQSESADDKLIAGTVTVGWTMEDDGFLPRLTSVSGEVYHDENCILPTSDDEDDNDHDDEMSECSMESGVVCGAAFATPKNTFTSTPGQYMRPSTLLHSPAAPLLMSVANALSDLDGDMLNIMVNKEQKYQPQSTYSPQHDVDMTMRPALYDWIMEVATEYGLHRETFHLAINYIERFLNQTSPVVINRYNYQLLGVSALYIACKLEESAPPTSDELSRTTDGACSAQQICAMEVVMLKTLNWQLNAQTPYAWTMIFIKSCIRAVYQRLYEQISVHFSQSPLCRHKFHATYALQLGENDFIDDVTADVIDAISLLPISPSTTCNVCCHIYGGVHEAVSDYLSVDAFIASQRLIDTLTFDQSALLFPPSAVAAASLMTIHRQFPDRLDQMAVITGYSVEMLHPILTMMHPWIDYVQKVPVSIRVTVEEQLQHHGHYVVPPNKQTHAFGAIDMWKRIKLSESNN